jgi:tetratricopeptide (TPR) repeat protein
MRRIVFSFLCLLLLFSQAAPGEAQPFDLLSPDPSLGDLLTNELRSLHDIERDLSLEKLNRGVRKIDALVELGDLRLMQGKLEEAERFFKMAIETEPNHMMANKGLAMVYYKSGQFGKSKYILERLTELYPLSDALRKDIDMVRADLATTGEFGVLIHEDNRGISEVVSSMEAYFPSFTWPRLSARYRLENWSFEDQTQRTNSRTLSAIFDYNLNHRTRLSAGYSPELLAGNKEIGGYVLHGVTGSSNLHLVSYYGRNAFKENPDTVKAALFEDFLTLTLIGELHERARISQSFTTTAISDNNMRRVFDTKILYFLVRRGIPLLSMELHLAAAGYERMKTETGEFYRYWTPSDHKRANLNFSWERGVGANWFWGWETQLTTSSFRDATPGTHYEQGAGFSLHTSYRFDTGRIHAKYTNSMKDYYRERILSVAGSFDF